MPVGIRLVSANVTGSIVLMSASSELSTKIGDLAAAAGAEAGNEATAARTLADPHTHTASRPMASAREAVIGHQGQFHSANSWIGERSWQPGILTAGPPLFPPPHRPKHYTKHSNKCTAVERPSGIWFNEFRYGSNAPNQAHCADPGNACNTPGWNACSMQSAIASNAPCSVGAPAPNSAWTTDASSNRPCK